MQHYLHDTTAAIQVTGLSKRIETRLLLNQLNLTVQPGESVSIVGESGSGKSTLLHILAGIESADSGSIQLCGQTMQPLTNEQAIVWRRRHIGLVFQSFYLLPHLTVAHNIALPCLLDNRPVDNPRVHQLLEAVGLASRANDKPSQLSGGEQQRVALARALVMRPALILADEPTGNLDSDNAQTSLQLLLNQCQSAGCSLLMVTHSEHAAASTARRLRLAHGQLHELP